MNIAVFLSGHGSNFESIAAAIERGDLNASIVLVASNRSNARGLQTAKEMELHTAVFDRKKFSEGKDFADYMLKVLHEHKTDYIVLAGYLRKIPPRVVRVYRNRITNIHPALLPKFGGQGMYGMNVHNAVIESGDKETGVTVHFVDEIYDHGEIIDQVRVPVPDDSTPESLAAMVLKHEHRFYPQVLQCLSDEFHKDQT